MKTAPQPLPGNVTFQAQRILIGALAAGVAIFAVVVAVIAQSSSPDPDGDPGPAFDIGVSHTAVAAALAVAAVALPFLVRSFLGKVPRERREEALAEVQSGVVPKELARAGIAGGALAEVPGLFACVLGLITGDVTFLTAAAVSVVAILAQLPSQESARDALRA